MPKPSTTKSAANRFEPATAKEKSELSKQKAASTQAPSLAITDIDDDEGAENTTVVQYVKALVTMGTSSSAVVDVPEWEIDVLSEIHGAEAIKVLSTHEVDYPYTAALAFQYLSNKYSTREQQDHIKSVYPRLRDFAKSTGLPYMAGDELGSHRQQSSVIYNDAPAKASAKQRAVGSGAGGSAAA